MKAHIFQFILTLFLVGIFGLPQSGAAGAVQHVALNTTARLNPSADTTQRIQFVPGATSASINGSLPANSSAHYVLRAMANQLMEVILSAPEGARLFVTGADGRALTPSTGSPAGFRGYLPRSGDYFLEVRSGSYAINYSFNVIIPRRVSFDPGTTSATLTGRLTSHQSRDYILRAMGGQLLEIDVSPANSVQMIIYGVDGTVLRSGMGEGSSFRGELPSSQDYLVTLRAGPQEVSYSMNVVIPRRISFRRGAISGTEYGSIGAYKSQYYVLRAMKNQNMQVDVTPVHGLQLIIYGADGTILKSGTGEESSFKGLLPSTQDYVVVLKAESAAVRYKLVATIW